MNERISYIISGLGSLVAFAEMSLLQKVREETGERNREGETRMKNGKEGKKRRKGGKRFNTSLML